MKREIGLFLALTCLHISLVFASPNSRVVDWINACRIDDWTSECVPTARKALPWCVDNATKDRISALMRTMQVHSPAKNRIVAATCFGTNVQLYYMPKRNEFLINPEIVKRDASETRWYECRGVRRPHHTSIAVKYLNSFFNENTATFHDMDAFAVECELDP